MKTLLLMRHGKSCWNDAALSDEQRPLNPRGRTAAVRMARLIQQQRLIPDRILCSTAVRTRQTCDLLQNAWNSPVDTLLLEELYLCPATGFPAVLRNNGADAGRLLVIGHNPGLADFLAVHALEDEKFPTAALAVLTVDHHTWGQFQTDTPRRLNSLFRPRDLD